MSTGDSRPGGLVTAWVCPRCGRSFGRTSQSHLCTPALSIEEYFANRDANQRGIFEAVSQRLENVGPVHCEAVDVGILFKRARTFAELRPRRHGMMLSLLLSRRLGNPRVSRIGRPSRNRTAYGLRLLTADDVDEEVRAWLTEAYADSPI